MGDADWTRWRGEIAKACDGSHHSIETIEAGIAEGRLTALYADGCCFVVELQDYPGVRACQALWVAGSLEAALAAAADLEAWARLKGCSEMLIEGHPAWQRALKGLGYRLWSVTVRKAL